MDYLTFDVPMPVWHVINGTAENSMVVAIEGGEPDAVLIVGDGSCVQDAGWRAAALFAGEKDETGWPTDDQLLPVTLRREHWEWVVGQVRRWQQVQTDDADEIAAEQRALDFVTAALEA